MNRILSFLVLLTFGINHATGQQLSKLITGDCEVLWKDLVVGTCMGESNNLLPYDLDSDGTMELIVPSGTGWYGNTGQWFILKFNPVSEDYDMVYMSEHYEDEIRKARLANVDQDPGMELLFIEDLSFYIFDLSSMQMDTFFVLPAFDLFSYIRQIRFADADNDGAAEIIISDDDRIILLDTADFSLEQEIVMEAGDFAVGNVDDDPDLEIVFTHGLTIELVNTTVSEEFDFRSTVSVAGGFIELADVDADGREEPVVAFPYQSITVYDAELELVHVLVPTSTNISALTVQNVQGDSTPELLYGDGQWGSIHCHSAHVGTFYWSIVNPLSATTGIAVADLDQDGENEVVWGSGCVSSGRDVLSIHQVNDQSFEWNTMHIDGPFHTVETGDVDGDGQIEIVTVSIESNEGYDSGILTIYDALSKTIEFRSAPLFIDDAGEIYAMEIDDYGDDNDMDIIIAAGDPHRGKFWIVDGDTHSIELEHSYSIQDGVWDFFCFDIADVDADNTKEFIAAGDNFITVINSLDFSIEWLWTISPTLPKPTGLLVGNIDADPELEIVLCKGLIRTYDNGSYQEALTTANNFSAMTLANWDGGGALEIIAGNSLGQVKIINGATLAETASFQVADVFINAIKAFNIDGQGEEELVVTAGDRVYFVRHDGTVVQSNLIEPQLAMYDALDVSDYDNDGEPNIVMGALRGVVELNPYCSACLWFETTVTIIDDNSLSPNPDGSIVLNVGGGTPPYTYQWTNGSDQSTLEDLMPGDYSVTIADAQSCSIDTTITINSVITSVEKNNAGALTLMPNPTQDQVRLYGVLEHETLLICDLQGRVMDAGLYTQVRSGAQLEIRVGLLKAGVYFLTLVSDYGSRSTRFIKL